MTQFDKTLHYLYTQLPMFQRTGPAAFKKNLGNILALCEKIGNPQDRFKSIHLAGTNGKGSTAHLLAAALQAAGLKVGVYTSPHYKDFRERIKINGKFISKLAVTSFVNKYKPDFKTIGPSFFEITVAMAFQYFAKQKVDIAIIETGLGGRLDSTNIITPLLSVITNISFDHQQFLGDTIPKIAGEKAGIIKSNVPVIIGETQRGTTKVFKSKAKNENSPIVFADKVFEVEKLRQNEKLTTYQVNKNGEIYAKSLPVNLHGDFQSKNIATALMAIEQLNELAVFPKISLSIIRKGWKNLKSLTTYLGRWQILETNPLTIADSAHNEAGLKMAIRQISAMKYKELHIVYGTVADKDVKKVFPILPKKATYYFVKADIPRGHEAESLRLKAEQFKLIGASYSAVNKGFKAAQLNAKKGDLVFVCGSIFVVAEVI